MSDSTSDTPPPDGGKALGPPSLEGSRSAAAPPFAHIELVLGTAFNLMARDPNYARRAVGGVHQLLVPAIATEQYQIVRAESGEAVAFATWALASDEVERKLAEGTGRLVPSDWQSGNVALLIDLIAPNRRWCPALVSRLKEERFPDTVFKERWARESDPRFWEWREVPPKQPDGGKPNGELSASKGGG